MNARRQALFAAASACGVVASCVVVAACGVLPPPGLKRPVFEVASVGLRDLDRNELRLLVTFDAHNPNEIAVPMTDLRVDFALAGRPVALGRATERTVTLAPGQRTAVPVEFSVPLAGLIETLRGIRADGPLPYRLNGSTRWGESPIPLNFERNGEFDGLRRLRGALQLLQRP